MKRIAIIPARSGSKGLPNKNVLELCGKPLLAWTVEAAVESKLFDRVILSTDSIEYGEIGYKYGAEVIYREKYLSDDKTSTFEVLENLFLNKIENIYDYFVLLQPTSPLRSSEDIMNACCLFESKYESFDFLVSVTVADHMSALINTINDGTLKNFDKDYSQYRRQNKKEFYPNGAIFIGKIDKYLIQKHFFGEKSLAFEMNKEKSVDIDDILDFKLAKLIMEDYKNV